MPSYAISYFITIILSSMGYKTRDALLLSAPPYVAAVRPPLPIPSRLFTVVPGYLLLCLRLYLGQDQEEGTIPCDPGGHRYYRSRDCGLCEAQRRSVLWSFLGQLWCLRMRTRCYCLRELHSRRVDSIRTHQGPSRTPITLLANPRYDYFRLFRQ